MHISMALYLTDVTGSVSALCSIWYGSGQGFESYFSIIFVMTCTNWEEFLII